MPLDASGRAGHAEALSADEALPDRHYAVAHRSPLSFDRARSTDALAAAVRLGRRIDASEAGSHAHKELRNLLDEELGVADLFEHVHVHTMLLCASLGPCIRLAVTEPVPGNDPSLVHGMYGRVRRDLDDCNVLLAEVV